MAISRTSSPVFLLCLAAAVRAVTNIQTVYIHSPTSGAVLNPLGAAINTKLQAKIYTSPYVYGQYSPYGGIGMGAGLAGYRGGISHLTADGYGALLGGYGGVTGYQYGYPGLPASYTVKTIYPPGRADYVGPAGYAYSGLYPNMGGYSYGFAGTYPSYGVVGFAGTYPSYGAVGFASSQYGVNHLGYSPTPGYLSFSAVNKPAATKL